MFGLLGKGFALYGYLPAIIETGESVGTLLKYKEFIESRSDISCYSKNILYFKSEIELIKKCESLVIARRPIDQYKLLSNLLEQNIKINIYLEKPLTHSCKTNKKMLEKLNSEGYKYRIGYTFEFTDWFSDVINLFLNKSDDHLELEIQWNFNAHHYVNNISTWKSKPSYGGGAFLFYGTHLISLLSHIGSWNNINLSSFRNSIDDEHKFIILGDNQKDSFNFSCDSSYSGEPYFMINITQDGSSIYNISIKDPVYRASDSLQIDSRIPMLKLLIESMASTKNYYDIYLRIFQITNQAIKNQTVFSSN